MKEQDFIRMYKDIKAPSSLHDSVFKLEEDIMVKNKIKSRRILRNLISGSAACFILITALTFFLNTKTSEPQVLYGGTVIGSEPVTIVSDEASAVSFGMKHISRSGIPLDISVKKEAKVSVSDGKLLVFDSKSGELLSVVTDITVDSDTSVKWDVSEITSEFSSLTLESEKIIAVYSLKFGDDGYTLCLTDSD